MFTLLWVSGWIPLSLSLDTVKFWEYLVYAWAYASAVYLLGLIVIVKYLRAWWLAAGFACFYLLIYAVNAGFLHHMGFMISPYFFWVGNLTHGMAFIKAYCTKWILFIAVDFVLTSFLAAWLIRRNAKALAQSQPWWLILLAILLWAAPVLQRMGLFRPMSVVTTVMHAPMEGALRVDQTFSLRLLAENPLVILGRVLFVNRLQPIQTRPAGELAAMSDAIKKWRLPLGHREYPPLGLKPFDQIIMFGVESLSLDFLSPYNTNLPPELTPFYASPAIASKMFLDYECVSLPTQPGLTVTYNSHPNVGAMLAASRFESSLVKLLDAHGYATYFLMSGPETFLNDNVLFKQMGFQHIMGSQTWLQDPRYAPFVSERGLMDRALYKIALDLMAQNRGKKIFIDVMTGDTHSPIGREDYGSLQYPPTPASVLSITSNTDVQAILRTIFRHDYDIGHAVREIEERNLLTEDTLVILTADHNYPHGEVLNEIPGYPKSFFSRIPLVFLSGQTLPPSDDLRQLHTQLDFAPTIVHLLGWPVPDGWWGESMFSPSQNAPSVSKFGRNLNVKFLDGSQQTVSMDNPKNADEKDLVTLFSSVYTDSPPATATGSQTNQP